MADCCTVHLRVVEDGPIAFGASEYVPMVPIPLPEYDGPYEVTPTSAAQTLPTAGLAMAADLTVAPIPSNYGLISVSGHVITVS